MNSSFLVAARRTAVVPRNGAFADLQPHELAAPVVRQLLDDAGIPGRFVGEVVAANSLGEGGNLARLTCLSSGLPLTVPGLTVDRQCAGGLDAIVIADSMIRSGLHDIVIAGGVESYSRRPLRFRTLADGSEPLEYDQARFTPWSGRDPEMSVAADMLARKLKIDRFEQDEWAIDSHRKAMAVACSKIEKEIVKISGVERDTFSRPLNRKTCSRARVVHGSITSANMAVAADGAAFVVVVSECLANQLGKPVIEIVSGKTTGDDPELPGLAPVRAIGEVLKAARTCSADIDVAEVMEAFAVQAIACQRGAGIPAEVMNPGGGSLARGHPIGASGAILAVRLFHELRLRGGTGLAAIAAAGGLGTALLVRT